jgi:hypothetical protein
MYIGLLPAEDSTLELGAVVQTEMEGKRKEVAWDAGADARDVPCFCATAGGAAATCAFFFFFLLFSSPRYPKIPNAFSTTPFFSTKSNVESMLNEGEQLISNNQGLSFSSNRTSKPSR